MIRKLTQHVVVRFIISGGLSACVNLSVFFVLNSILRVYYITSSVSAFIIAFFFSFTLHKFWTFKSHGVNQHKQMAMYLGTSLFGLGLNTILMYVFVDLLHIYPFVSQVLSGGLVAFCSFALSHNFVFKYKNNDVLELDIN